MSVEVESRRFRTWEQDARGHAVRNWWLLLRYLTQRYIRVWYVWMVIILGLFGSALGLFLMTLEGSDLPVGANPRIIQQGPMAFIGIGMALFTLLVTAPSVAEDLRFNAQLFYFSRPMRISDYLVGKTAFNFIGIALVGLIPILVLSLTTLSLGPGDEAALRAALADHGYSSEHIERRIAEFHAQGVDSWADVFYVAFMPVLAVVSLSIGLVGLTMAMSSFTRRAWHAAVGTVVVLVGWSFIGDSGTGHIRGSERLLSHPFGWLEAVAFLPFDHRFRPADCDAFDPASGDRFSRCGDLFERLANAEVTIWTSHLLFVALGVLGLLVTWARLRQVEGAK